MRRRLPSLLLVLFITSCLAPTAQFKRSTPKSLFLSLSEHVALSAYCTYLGTSSLPETYFEVSPRATTYTPLTLSSSSSKVEDFRHKIGCVSSGSESYFGICTKEARTYGRVQWGLVVMAGVAHMAKKGVADDISSWVSVQQLYSGCTEGAEDGGRRDKDIGHGPRNGFVRTEPVGGGMLGGGESGIFNSVAGAV